MVKIKTKHKVFSTKVDGTWVDFDILGHSATGHWHWHEAKEKLLSALDEWKDTVIINNILSAVFHKKKGEVISEGASLELEIIYEEMINSHV